MFHTKRALNQVALSIEVWPHPRSGCTVSTMPQTQRLRGIKSTQPDGTIHSCEDGSSDRGLLPEALYPGTQISLIALVRYEDSHGSRNSYSQDLKAFLIFRRSNEAQQRSASQQVGRLVEHSHCSVLRMPGDQWMVQPRVYPYSRVGTSACRGRNAVS